MTSPLAPDAGVTAAVAAAAGTQYAFDVQVAGGVVDESLLRRDLVDQLWQPGA